MTKSEKCSDCLCDKCMFTMPHGDSTDCHNCELCLNGDCKKCEGECTGFKGWN